MSPINAASAALIAFAAAAACPVSGVAQGMPPMVMGAPPTRDSLSAPSPLLLMSAMRTASGTAWEPDAAPMGMAMGTIASMNAWNFQADGMAFVQYDRQFSKRGASQLGSLNWLMGSASRLNHSDRIQFRAMLSADPLTVTPRGYPLLLQTGEVYHNQPIHDRQHPHDLFMEIGALYERTVSRSAGVSLYAAPVGEPATGPVAYPHRASARDNPFAPLGHHWQDATHISFGVATVGVFTNKARLEGSIFNGREPDEIRTNFDFRGAHLDSYSGRLTVNPAASWSILGSYVYLRNPESVFAQTSSGQLVKVSDRDVPAISADLEPVAPRGHVIVAAGTAPSQLPITSLHRMAFSASDSKLLSGDRSLSSTAIFARQKHAYDQRWAVSTLLEESFAFSARSSIFSRAELVQKTAGDLDVPPPPTPTFSVPGSVLPDYQSRRFNIGEFTLGATRGVATVPGFGISLGMLATANMVPPGLWGLYGTRMPLGTAAFLVIRPASKPPASMQGM